MEYIYIRPVCYVPKAHMSHVTPTMISCHVSIFRRFQYPILCHLFVFPCLVSLGTLLHVDFNKQPCPHDNSIAYVTLCVFVACVGSETQSCFFLRWEHFNSCLLSLCTKHYDNRILSKHFHNFDIGPQIYQIYQKAKCNIGETICVAVAFYLHWDKKPTQSKEIP